MKIRPQPASLRMNAGDETEGGYFPLNQDDWKKGHVDEIAKRARNAGLALKSDPHDTEWKSRAFEVSDPSGFLLTIFSETTAG